MKKYTQTDHRDLAVWAADCAERVLPLFESEYPEDKRPRQAIETLRKWVRTSVFQMAEIRGTSLAAHAAARQTEPKSAACYTARSAGQAVATAHVPQHSFGAAYYALKAIMATAPGNAETEVKAELEWQIGHAPVNLRPEVIKRVVIQKGGRGVLNIKVIKDKDY